MMQAVQRLARYKQLIAPMVLETAVDHNGILTVSPRWLSAADIPSLYRSQNWRFYCGWYALQHANRSGH
jgi:hypothetical protein